MTPINPKITIAGAAIGAYTQDPIDNPIAGTVGLGIGAYIGSTIKPEIIGKEAPLVKPESVFRVSQSDLQKVSIEYEAASNSLVNTLRSINRVSNKGKVGQEFLTKVAEAYKELGGSSDLQIDHRALNLFKLGSSKDSEYHTLTEEIIKGMVPDEEEAKKLRMAFNAVDISIEDVTEMVNGKPVTKKFGIVSDDLKITPFSELNIKDIVAVDPSDVISLGASSTVAKREETIRQHLIEKLNYPEGLAARISKNLAIGSEGTSVDISGNKFNVTADGKTHKLELEEFRDFAGLSRREDGSVSTHGYPVRVDNSGNVYTSSRTNEFMALPNGQTLGSQISVISPSGEILTDNRVNSSLKINSFTAAENALFMFNAGGRREDLTTLFNQYDKGKTYIGHSSFIKSQFDLGNQGVRDAFLTSSYTNVERQMYFKDGQMKFRNTTQSDYEDFAKNALTIQGDKYAHPTRSLGQNSMNKLILQELSEDMIIPSVGTHTKRATDTRLNRRKIGTSNEYTQEVIDELNNIVGPERSKSFTSGINGASMISIKGVDNSSNEIVNLFTGGASLGDGQIIINREALAGTSVKGNFTIDLGKLDNADGRIVDLTKDSEFTDQLRAMMDGQRPQSSTKFNGGQRLAINDSGRTQYVPKEYTSAEMLGYRLKNNGSLIVDMIGEYDPSNLNNVDIKLFGDIKATAVAMDKHKFNKMSFMLELNERGGISDGNIVDKRVLADLNKLLGRSKTVKISLSDAVETLEEMSSDDFNNLSKKYGFAKYQSIARSNDLGITARMAKIDSIDKAKVYVDQELSRFENQNLADRIRSNILGVAKDDADYINRAKGLSMAIAAFEDDKSSQTGFATLVRGNGNKSPREMAEEILSLNSILKNARLGDEDAQYEVFDRFSRLNNSSGVVTTLSSVDLPIADWKSPTISWMHKEELVRSGFTDEMIDQIANKNYESMYEARSLLLSNETFGNTDMSDVFGKTQSEQARNISTLFDTSVKDRHQVLKDISGMASDDGIISIKLDRPGEIAKSLSLNLNYTGRTGVFDADGNELLSEMDKRKRDVLLAQSNYRQAQNSGNTKRLEVAERNLDNSIRNLEDVMKRADNPLAKSAYGRTAKFGADANIRFMGGESSKVWDELYNKGIMSLTLDRESISNIGFDERNGVMPDGTKVKKSRFLNDVDLGEGRYTLLDENDKPIFMSVGREPIGGSNARLTTNIVVDNNITPASGKGGIYFPEAPMGSGEQRSLMASVAKAMQADADGDKVVAYSLHSLNKKENWYNVVKQDSDSLIRRMKEDAPAVTATLAKANKGASKKFSIGTSGLQDISGTIQGHERKFLAPQVTELNQIIAEAIERQRRSDEKSILSKYGLKSVEESSNLESSVKSALDNELKTLREERGLASAVGMNLVENSLKAVHKDGSKKSAEAPVLDILGKLRQSTKFNGASKEAAGMTSSLISDLFMDNARNIDASAPPGSSSAVSRLESSISYIHKALSNYGGEIATDPFRMVGGGGKGEDVSLKNIKAAGQAEARGRASSLRVPESIATLPSDGKSSIIGDIDIQKSLIKTISENKKKIIGGTAALAAASFFIGRDTPDMSSPIQNSPVARTGAVLPALRQENGYITSPINRDRESGSVEINARSLNNYSEANFKRNISNMLQGDTFGRSTVRYQHSESY